MAVRGVAAHVESVGMGGRRGHENRGEKRRAAENEPQLHGGSSCPDWKESTAL
jgi:hypothetical protein